MFNHGEKVFRRIWLWVSATAGMARILSSAASSCFSDAARNTTTISNAPLRVEISMMPSIRLSAAVTAAPSSALNSQQRNRAEVMLVRRLAQRHGEALDHAGAEHPADPVLYGRTRHPDLL